MNNILKGSWRTSLFGVLLIISAITKFALAQLDGDPSTNIAPSDLMNSILAGWALLLARENVVSSEQVGAVPVSRSAGPAAGVGLLIIFLMTTVGCAKFSGVTERQFEGTNVVSEVTRFRGFTFLDSKANLTKAKSLQTEKTQSVGVDASAQESTGKTITDVTGKVMDGLPNVIKKSVIP